MPADLGMNWTTWERRPVDCESRGTHNMLSSSSDRQSGSAAVFSQLKDEFARAYGHDLALTSAHW